MKSPRLSTAKRPFVPSADGLIVRVLLRGRLSLSFRSGSNQEELQLRIKLFRWMNSVSNKCGQPSKLVRTVWRSGTRGGLSLKMATAPHLPNGQSAQYVQEWHV